MASAPNASRRTHASASAVSAVIALGLFLLDLKFWPDVNVPELYVIPVLLSFWQARERDTVIAAAGCSLLTVAALWWSPYEGWNYEAANRVLTLVGLWVTALLVVRFRRSDSEVQLLAAIVSSSDDAIIGSTLNGTITTWNDGAERLYGYRAHEVVGRSVQMFMPADRQDEWKSILDRVGRGDRISHFRTVRIRQDGQPIDISLTVSPLRDPTGAVVGVSAIGRDITSQVRVEREASLRDARIRSILDTAVDGIIVIDRHGTIQIANPAVSRLFGYDGQSLIGRPVTDLMPPPHREQHDSYIARYIATGRRHVIGIGREVEGQRADGSRFPVSLAVSEMTHGGEHAFTGIIHDLTEAKRAEAKLREQAALARLGQMAALIAHEVRNPLAGLRGALDVIRRRLPPEGREQLVINDMKARLDGLNEFVSDLLVFARPRPPVVTHVAVSTLLNGLAQLLRSDPEFAGIDLQLSGPDVMLAVDAQLVERALLNVIVNAAHAMNRTGTIRIETRVDESTCHISIIDSGTGMPPEVHARLFEPFFTTKHRGTGLGLAVVKRTVDQHAGSIDVRSAPGEGTTVTIHLPVGDPTAVATA